MEDYLTSLLNITRNLDYSNQHPLNYQTTYQSVKIIFLLLIFVILLFPAPAFAHKLIPTDGSNTSIDSALQIPDPVVSWAMYEKLDGNILYYEFEAEKGERLHASIVIPKLDGLENFTPSLALIGPSFALDSIEMTKAKNNFPYTLPEGYNAIVFDYEGKLPSTESYEPFGQITYWERQEVNLNIPVDGTYYLSVYDSDNNAGKLAVAIGYVEDFSAGDFVTILPSAWLESRYFVDDYTTPVISMLIFFGILSGIGYLIYRKIKRKKVISEQ